MDKAKEPIQYEQIVAGLLRLGHRLMQNIYYYIHLTKRNQLIYLKLLKPVHEFTSKH